MIGRNVLEFRDVTAGYHKKPVIRDVTFAIGRGEMVGLLGPNGAGKTTLLRCVTGLCPPMTGAARIFDTEVSRLSAPERAKLVALVPQEVDIPVAFTVSDIVLIGRTAALNRWERPSKHDRLLVERAMVYTDVSDMKNRPFTELSSGEKQRAIVAMALAQDPRVILMDEATSNLDMNHRLEIMLIVERLNREKGVTVLMISHDLNLAADFCKRLLLMDNGRLVADGPPSRVLNEDVLRRVYRCDVRVEQNPTNGSITVVPSAGHTEDSSGRGIRVHVIAGGGCGAEVLRRLILCSYTVTCGVLNDGDTDAGTASALGIETALEKPFSPVGDTALDLAREMARRSQALVVCGVPFGSGNLANLDLATEALAEGKQVLIMQGIGKRDYTAGHQATERIRVLADRGAKIWTGTNDLTRELAAAKRDQ